MTLGNYWHWDKNIWKVSFTSLLMFSYEPTLKEQINHVWQMFSTIASYFARGFAGRYLNEIKNMKPS